MLNQPTLHKLRALKLTGMADAFTKQLEQPLLELDFNERLAILVEEEWLLRENRKVKRRITHANLQQPACLEDINYELNRGFTKARILELSQNHWVKHHLNILITGPTGCGKTYLGCALIHNACVSGYTSRYYRVSRLWEELKVAKANGTYNQWLMQLAKIDIIILDDWGLVVPDLEQRQDLLEILDDRYKKRSTIVTSQLPVKTWYEYIQDPTFADAIMDRLVHNAVNLNLTGSSMRKHNNLKEVKEN